MSMTKNQIKKKALNFRLWRIGVSIGWDCTAADLAREVGCTRETAARHVRESGWPIGGGHRQESAAHDITSAISSVDVQMRKRFFN